MYWEKRENGLFILRLETEETVHKALTTFASKLEIQAGLIMGIGALSEVELGYFNTKTHQY